MRRPKGHPKRSAPRTAQTSGPGSARAHAFAALSGFSALVYQLLWLKQLGLLFGNTAHAAAVGLTVFFLGLAVGGWFWGRHTSRATQPLRLYACLELGIAAAAVLSFALLRVYHAIYAPVTAIAGDGFLLLLLTKFVLAVLLLGPAAFLIGGTYPVLGHAIVARPDTLGTLGTSLYGVNTIGAAAGAFAAGFVLPAWIGFTGAYLLAMAINVAVGYWAWRVTPAADVANPPAVATMTRESDVRPAWIWIIACGSGVLTLALEVAWTRMFAQVLENTVYTFSIILVVFLVALGLGSWLASAVARLRLDPGMALTIALTLAGVSSAAVPSAFVALTDGLETLGAARTWSEHVWSVVRAGAILLPAGLAAGFVFPYLMRVMPVSAGVGSVLGSLVAVNTWGAIAGSLATGFVMLAWAGLWRSLATIAFGYLLLGVVAAISNGRGKSRLALVSAGALVVALFTAAQLPLLHLDAARQEQLVEAWEGPHGITAIVRQDRGLRLKLNNSYSLGGTADDPQHERNQTLIPLLTHPRPDAVFFLGLGAGVTAGEATRHPVQRILVCELVPDVITAAQKHFAQEARGLFTDPRASILAEDGRSYLAATRDRFDVVISDLFVPWHAGTGGLYSREHFETVRSRLTPEGMFVQWLPLFQLSRREFFTVARTMLDVFPQVVMWRGDFYANKAIVALVGSSDLHPLERDTLRRNIERLSAPSTDTDLVEAVVLTYYIGNLTAARDVIPAGPLNTDDRPLVEYLAPRAAYERSSESAWFQSHGLAAFQQQLLERVPPGRDPYLIAFPEADRQPVQAGLEYYRAISYSVEGRDGLARRHVEAFLDLMPSNAVVGGPFLSLDKLLDDGS